VVCAGLFIVVFLGENLLVENPGQSALVLGGAIVGLLTAYLLMTRPGLGVVRWSSIAGVAWLIAFGPFVIRAIGDPDGGPLLSSTLITFFGIAGAIVAFWAGRSSPAAVS